MTNEELLLAMSDMMDTKLRAEIRPLRNEIQDVKDELRNELQDIKGELQNEIQDVRNELHGVESELRSEIQDVRNELRSVESELHSETQSLRSEIHQIKLFQENVILPRLCTIESCYLDTYRRYRDNADRMEAVYEDVDMMKKVLAEHCKQLQKLA